MENPYAPPLSDCSQEDNRPATASAVQWARPRFTTFANLSLLWGFSTGVPLGIIVFLASLIGAKTTLDLGPWHWRGTTAGAISIVAVPIFCSILGALVAIFFPLFRLAVAVAGGPKLCLRAARGNKLHFGRLRLGSYLKLSAIFGLLLSLFGVVLLIPISLLASADDISAAGIPGLFHGYLRLIWFALSLPIFYVAYSAVLGLLAFIPFRIVARFAGNAYLRPDEVSACEKGSSADDSPTTNKGDKSNY